MVISTGSDSSNSDNYEPNREHYPDVRLVGSWNDALDKSNVVGDDNLNPMVAHDIEILRQYACKGDVANMRPRVYTDEDERGCYQVFEEPLYCYIGALHRSGV